MEPTHYPKCQNCSGVGVLVPLSDFHHSGVELRWKAWVCTNPNCTFQISINRGNVFKEGNRPNR